MESGGAEYIVQRPVDRMFEINRLSSGSGILQGIVIRPYLSTFRKRFILRLLVGERKRECGIG